MALDKTPEPAPPHQMDCEAETAAEVLFVCRDEACGRRVVVGKRQPRLTVIDRGDWHIPHVGSLGGLVIDGVEAA
ncbi:hypothetical protein HH310_23465 [Actinoplanes sp. TBRC 11911]|uniref:hypothetical protein n=1 Tax=Actinoplanes sp. TBRC 11911 TaxID=2729386 RepID=UPI00145E5970|nr:hypothetical protein [Actinoplanes sp. TBRC 11911]NMO54129.1 hypothetical protein [Actinoplanes sp. TBRC 11911]